MKPERESSIAKPGRRIGKTSPGDGRAKWTTLVKRWRLASESLYDVTRTAVDQHRHKTVTRTKGRDRVKGQSPRKICQNNKISVRSPGEDVKDGNSLPREISSCYESYNRHSI